MEKRNKLSIIIPTLNEEQSIGALLTQLHENAASVPHEVIVVDAESTDRTREIALQHAARVLVTEPGRGGQLNRGAACATGDVLWFLHADSKLDSECIPKLLEKIATGIKGGCFQIRFRDSRFAYRVIAWGSNVRAKRFKSFYGDQGIFVERELFQSLNGFPELPIMEDLEFSRRLRRKAAVAMVEATIWTSPRRFRKGILKTLLLMQALKIAYFCKVDPFILAKVYGAGKKTSFD
jgi:rSAM/selenodomain-associated transferase 2